MPALPRITFGLIVLNGEPFTRYNLRSLYPFAHEIIVVEGASQKAAATASADGHSMDGTLEVLRHFKADEDPENKVTIITAEDHGHASGFWPGEKDEQSQAYAQRATGDYLWQVDIDEFYTSDDLRAVATMLERNPELSGVSFYWKNFWGGFDYLTDGWDYRHAVEQMNGIRRVFRWSSDYRYVTHRPPTVVDGEGRDLCSLSWASHKKMARLGIFCYHYGMVFPKQSLQKTLYYKNMWKSHENMEAWRDESYVKLSRPFSIIHGTKPPSWLKCFNGIHPEQIKQLINDQEKGHIGIGRRPTTDIEKLVKAKWYRAATVVLEILYYSLPAMRKLRHLAATVARQLRSFVRGGLKWLALPRTTSSIAEPLFALSGRRKGASALDLASVKRILVVRLDDIGDLVMTSAFLRELRRNCPAARITLVVKPQWYNLVETCHYVDEVLTHEPNAEPAYWRRLRPHVAALKLSWHHLWQRRFDLAISPRWDVDYYDTGVIVYFSGARWRLGYRTRDAMNRFTDGWFTHALPADVLRHEADQNLELLRCAGGTVNDNRLELWTTEHDERYAQKTLGLNSPSKRRPLVALGIGAGSAKRIWPQTRYAELARWMADECEFDIVLLGGRRDEDIGRETERLIGRRAVNLINRLTLRQLVAVLKRCFLFVGNDSGPMHIAAAAAVPVVEISCHPATSSALHTNSPVRFGPWGVRFEVCQPKLARAPCRDGCDALRPHCILDVTVEEVKEAVLAQHDATWQQYSTLAGLPSTAVALVPELRRALS